jgi:hypothetical protein
MKKTGCMFLSMIPLLFMAGLFCGCKGESGTNLKDVSEVADAVQTDISLQDLDSYHRETDRIEVATDDAGFEDGQILEDILTTDFPSEDVETVVGLTLLKGPYLQWVTDKTIVVLIETKDDAEGFAGVEVSDEGGGLVGTTDFTFSKTFEKEGFPPIDTYLGKAKIENLKPNTKYDYCVVSKGSKVACDAFWTAPLDKAYTPFTFVAFGDNRTDNDAHKKVIDGILSVSDVPHFAINTGDLVAVGTDLTQWQEFFDIERPLLSKMAYYPVIGNHEYPFWGKEYFQAWFDLDAPLGDELNYSFVFGNCAFVALNTNEDVTKGQVFDWMVAQLQSYHEANYHVFVVTHHPIYTCSNHPPYEGGVEFLVPEFERYGVVAVLSGHNHLYEHFFANGIHYLTLGGGGAPLYDEENDTCDQPRVMWKKVHHHMIVSVDGGKVQFTAFDDDAQDTPQVIEHFQIP